jgi:hypothetical protein
VSATAAQPPLAIDHLYQAVSDAFCGPTDSTLLLNESLDTTMKAGSRCWSMTCRLATAAAAASRHIKLVMLLNGYTQHALRNRAADGRRRPASQAYERVFARASDTRRTP